MTFWDGAYESMRAEYGCLYSWILQPKIAANPCEFYVFTQHLNHLIWVSSGVANRQPMFLGTPTFWLWYSAFHVHTPFDSGIRIILLCGSENCLSPPILHLIPLGGSRDVTQAALLLISSQDGHPISVAWYCTVFSLKVLPTYDPWHFDLNAIVWGGHFFQG